MQQRIVEKNAQMLTVSSARSAYARNTRQRYRVPPQQYTVAQTCQSRASEGLSVHGSVVKFQHVQKLLGVYAQSHIKRRF
eukprot:m.881627 g.881627  ORF g.881627 m.881627 type:complete len:80 (-) comp23596_c0_seq11:1533-1772(-)